MIWQKKYLMETDSTNRYLKELAAAGAPEGTVIIAGRQSAGRGRLGRSFFSPEEKGIYMSLLLRPEIALERSVLITSMAAVAVARAIERTCGVNAKIKWVNDIFIHNKICCGALRYSVTIDGELYASEILGDGVGLSTVHGSTAYFRSITRGIFRTGMGLAFSNATADVSHLVLPETAVIEIKILRGPGLVIADNSPVSEIAENEVITLSLAPQKAAVIGIEEFMCPECCKTRHCRGN